MPLSDFPAACLTNWGAVLGLPHEPIESSPVVLVSNPDTVDAGQFIGKLDIKLLWRVKLIKRWCLVYAINNEPKYFYSDSWYECSQKHQELSMFLKFDRSYLCIGIYDYSKKEYSTRTIVKSLRRDE